MSPVLKGKGVIAMSKTNGRRAKGGRSADDIIKLSLWSPHRKSTRERKRSPRSLNTRIRARASDCNIHNQVLMRSRETQPHGIYMLISGGPKSDSASPQMQFPPINSHVVRNAMRGVRTHASRSGAVRLIQVPPQESVPD
jgi:hypothetical protein